MVEEKHTCPKCKRTAIYYGYESGVSYTPMCCPYCGKYFHWYDDPKQNSDAAKAILLGIIIFLIVILVIVYFLLKLIGLI